MAFTPYLNINSLTGGVIDNDPPLSLPEDACTIAENVEFFYSALGERRKGCVAINLPDSITGDSNIQAVTWMGRHLPSNTLGDAELWLLSQHLTSTNNVLTHRSTSAWATVTPDDAISVTSGDGHRLSGISLHGKFFLAYNSSVDQLHVWDGTTLRKTGLAQPGAAPTGVDTGVPGVVYATIRYFRVRYVTVSGSTVLRRSEPSAVLSFTPSGAGTGVIITKPAAISQGETHWELEASTDNANFYRIARTVVGTTTYTDSTAFATGYTSGTLSEALTAYTLIPSGKFLSVDADRLLIAGSWENSAYASRLWWTPVLGNTGVGNDERLDMTVNPYIDLNGFEGGEITGLSKTVSGYVYVFKWSHIYKVVRTGIRSNAYSAIPLTTARGALPGSLVEATDQAGNPALYFLDPRVGPMRVGNNGVEWCGRDVRNLWERINLEATVSSHGVFYQCKNQVHFWVALDGADYPNAKIVVHCNELTPTDNGARRGWVTVPVGNRIADAHCSLMFSPNVDSTDTRGQDIVPFIGKQQWIVGGVTIKNLVQQCDIGSTDCFTTGDTKAYYYAIVQSKPFIPVGLLNKYNILSATLAVECIPKAVNYVYVKAIRDFGLEQLVIPVDMYLQADETIMIKKVDNFSFGEAVAVQLAFGDLNDAITPASSWRLHAFGMKTTQGQTS